MSVSKIIESLATESSSNKKLEILKANSENTTLKLAFNYCLNPMFNFWIKIKKKEIDQLSVGNNTINDLLLNTVFDSLANRVVTGHSARELFKQAAETLTREEQLILCAILNRDMNCKVSVATVNKVWKDMIPIFPVMLSENYEDYWCEEIPEGEIIVQKKEDGGRVQVLVNNEGIPTFYSRSGNILETHGFFDTIFSNLKNVVFDGELLVLDDTGIVDRKTGNGYYTKAVRGTISLDEVKKFHIVFWDVIPVNDFYKKEYNLAYKDRLKQLCSLIDYSVIPTKYISVVETHFVKTHQEAQKLYQEFIQKGWEGMMVKNPLSPWVADRVRFSLKCKESKDATLLCYAVEPHSKNPNMIGSLHCMSSDGLLKVSVGSGLTDLDRLKDSTYFVDKFINVIYNSVISDKSSDIHSLFLPRYNCVRDDVIVADSLDKIKGK